MEGLKLKNVPTERGCRGSGHSSYLLFTQCLPPLFLATKAICPLWIFQYHGRFVLDLDNKWASVWLGEHVFWRNFENQCSIALCLQSVLCLSIYSTWGIEHPGLRSRSCTIMYGIWKLEWHVVSGYSIAISQRTIQIGWSVLMFHIYKLQNKYAKKMSKDNCEWYCLHSLEMIT